MAKSGYALNDSDGTNVLNIASQAQGDVLYYNGTSWVRLAPGTSGQFLKTLGAAANPTWSGLSGALTGKINAIAEVKDVATFNDASGAFVDVTGFTVDIVTSQTCTILAYVFGEVYHSATGGTTDLQIVIGGTSLGIARYQSIDANTRSTTVSAYGRKAAVAAATTTVKVQLKASTGTGSLNGSAAGKSGLLVIAIEE